jgi:hypothetical protein
MRIDPKNVGVGQALAVITLLATVGVGAALGVELAVLTLAGGVLVIVVFVLWNSVLNLTGESTLTLEEAVSMAAPTAEEEQKRAVLRTLKDLEYELSVGKISEQDYKELSHKYRERAKELIRAADEGMASGRDKAEQLLERRLKANAKKKNKGERQGASKKEAGTRRVEKPRADGASESEDPLDESAIAPKSDDDTRQGCPECDTENEADAKFCKKCGVELEHGA